MAEVRVLVGTRKGAFVLRSDEGRRDWRIEGPHFAGWQVMHVAGSPADPDRIWASQWTDWHGQVVQRSDDGGRTWSPVGNAFPYASDPGTHRWYDDSPHPWEFSRVWHLEASPSDPERVFAGVEDAGLFRSDDGGATWAEVPGVRTHPTGEGWHPGAGGLCLHTILIDPGDERRMWVAISAAGALRSEDGGETWRLATGGLRSEFLPDPEAPVGHCVHRIALHPARPDTLFMQKHWDVCRSDDGGETWTEVSGDLPTDFGFPVAVHAHEPDTVYVVPITSDALHYPPDGRLRVARSRSGGGEWELLGDGLPQRDCYVNVLRDAMAVDDLDDCGVYVGTTGGQVYASPDGGDTWTAIAEHLPSVLSVEVQAVR